MDAAWVIRQTRGSVSAPLVLEAGDGRTVTVPVGVLRAVATHFPTVAERYLALMAVASRAILVEPPGDAVFTRAYRARLADVQQVIEGFEAAQQSGLY